LPPNSCETTPAAFLSSCMISDTKSIRCSWSIVFKILWLALTSRIHSSSVPVVVVVLVSCEADDEYAAANHEGFRFFVCGAFSRVLALMMTAAACLQ